MVTRLRLKWLRFKVLSHAKIRTVTSFYCPPTKSVTLMGIDNAVKLIAFNRWLCRANTRRRL